MGYFYIFGTVFFTVYGQLIIKGRIGKFGELPDSFTDKMMYIVTVLLDPWILSGFLSAFIASIFWIAAMTKFDISYAYPFMSSAFVLVFLLSIFLFNEPVTWQKTTGLVLIVTGIVVTSRSI